MKFDWHKENLTLETIIDSNYKNTQNVRRFFKSNLGEDFTFSRDFMQWLKSNTGKSLEDAINQYKNNK